MKAGDPMNDKLRKKLTEQQEYVETLAQANLSGIEKCALQAHEERNAVQLKMLEMYWLGVKDMKTSIIAAIEAEKQKKGK